MCIRCVLFHLFKTHAKLISDLFPFVCWIQCTWAPQGNNLIMDDSTSDWLTTRMLQKYV